MSSAIVVDQSGWARTPGDILRCVFLFVPVDERLRCKEVCKPWRLVAKDPALYAEVDLGDNSGVAVRSAALLVAVGVAAAGHLRKLDVTGWEDCDMSALCVVARLSARTLAEVHACGLTSSELLVKTLVDRDVLDRRRDPSPLYFEDAEGFLKFAPACNFIDCDIWADAASFLDHEASEVGDHDSGRQLTGFLKENDDPGRYRTGGVVRVRTLHLRGAIEPNWGGCEGDVPLDWPPFEEIARSHKTLTGLTFSNFVENVPSVEAICELAIHLKLKRLEFDHFGLQHDDLPHLVRVLSAGDLETFFASHKVRVEWEEHDFDDGDIPLWHGPHTAAFIAALKASNIKSYTLPPSTMTREFGLAVISAFEGHPTLEELDLGYSAAPLDVANRGEALAELGSALTRLVCSGGALRVLKLGWSRCLLRKALAPLFAAVAVTNTLRELHCGQDGPSWSQYSGAILGLPLRIADHMLTAVRTNTSLRSLIFPATLLETQPQIEYPEQTALKEAVELVACRTMKKMITTPAPTYLPVREPPPSQMTDDETARLARFAEQMRTNALFRKIRQRDLANLLLGLGSDDELEDDALLRLTLELIAIGQNY
jgi:hypothetical protein